MENYYFQKCIRCIDLKFSEGFVSEPQPGNKLSTGFCCTSLAQAIYIVKLKNNLMTLTMKSWL